MVTGSEYFVRFSKRAYEMCEDPATELAAPWAILEKVRRMPDTWRVPPAGTSGVRAPLTMDALGVNVTRIDSQKHSPINVSERPNPSSDSLTTLRG